jgi:hypothetical protein
VLFLSLLWLLIGLVIGSLAWMVRCYPPSWQRLRWLRMLVLGALVALAAGWLGVLLTGRFFATALALWVTVLCVVVLPRGSHWLHERLHIKSHL